MNEKCKRHAWEVNYNNPMGLYLRPDGHKDQYVAVRCTRCQKSGWRNTRTNSILNR